MKLLFYICYNDHTRRGTHKRKSKICDRCKKVKKLLGSFLFYTSKNWSWWSKKRHLWMIDWNDYRWICRDCVEQVLDEWEIEPISEMAIRNALSERKSLYVC